VGGHRPQPKVLEDIFDHRRLLDEGFVASLAEQR